MKNKLLTTRRLILVFMICLFISGLTAIPVEPQLELLLRYIAPGSILYLWIEKVLLAYRETSKLYPFLLYGYDWLAFAHFVLAILFIGPYRNPTKNIWVVEFGLIACVLVIPYACIAGHFRDIPLGWRLIDCSFGIIGLAVLWPVHRLIIHLSKTIQPKTKVICQVH